MGFVGVVAVVGVREGDGVGVKESGGGRWKK